jgi:hypothetical protein
MGMDGGGRLSLRNTLDGTVLWGASGARPGQPNFRACVKAMGAVQVGAWQGRQQAASAGGGPLAGRVQRLRWR